MYPAAPSEGHACRACGRDRRSYGAYLEGCGGLCHPCYADPGARARHGLGRPDPYYGRDRPARAWTPPPDCPTSAMPGTPEKIEAMARRAARWQGLFHPGDATLPPGAKNCRRDLTLVRLRSLLRALRPPLHGEGEGVGSPEGGGASPARLVDA